MELSRSRDMAFSALQFFVGPLQRESCGFVIKVFSFNKIVCGMALGAADFRELRMELLGMDILVAIFTELLLFAFKFKYLILFSTMALGTADFHM